MESSKLNQFFSEAEQKAIQADALIAQLKATLAQQTSQVDSIAAELKAKWTEVESYKAMFANLWNPGIDYSFINDNVLADKLVSDCRKMAVARSGFRGSLRADDFAEFCGFVQLQIEGCFGYYYHIVSEGDINKYNARAQAIAAAYNSRPQVIAAKTQVSLRTETEFKYGSIFYLSNIEFSLHEKHKYYYFLIRDLMHYRNTQLFHRGTGVNDRLSEGAKASLQKLIDLKDFAKVESVLHFVTDLIRKALVELTAHQEEEEIDEEPEVSEEGETYAKEVEQPQLEQADNELVPRNPQLVPIPKAVDNT